MKSAGYDLAILVTMPPMMFGQSGTFSSPGDPVTLATF